MDYERNQEIQQLIKDLEGNQETEGGNASEAVEASQAEMPKESKETKEPEELKQEPEELKLEEKKQEEDSFSKKFAAMSRREKKLLEKEREIKAQSAELAEIRRELAELKKPKAEPKEEKPSLETLLRTNPGKALDALKDYGLDFDTLVNMEVNGRQAPIDLQVRLLKEEMERSKTEMRESFQQELNRLKQESQEREQQRQQQEIENQINNFKTNIVTHVERENAKDATKYAHIMVSDIDVSQEVCDLIGAHWERHKETLDYSDALDLIEEELRVRADRYRSIMSKQQPIEAPKPKAPQVKRTLTNESSASVARKNYASRDEEIKDLANSLKFTNN